MPLEKLERFRTYTNPDQTRIQQLYVIGSLNLAESRKHLRDFPSTNFVTFLIADFDSLAESELGNWTEVLINAGSRYFCAWGNRCEVAHEIFDEECSKFESDGESVIMTVDHRSESLDDAIWFALNCAVPAPPYDQNWNAILAVSINDTASLHRVRTIFTDPAGFCDERDA